jgi:hypothetical protein
MPDSKGSMIDGLVEAALAISAERARVLHRMKTALLANDGATVYKCARIVCGIEEPADGDPVEDASGAAEQAAV